MPDPTGPRPVRLRLEDVLDPNEEISERALLLVLVDELLANMGAGPHGDDRTRGLAERLRRLTARGASGSSDGLVAASPNALGEEETEIFNETWGASVDAVAWVQALSERLVPIIARGDGLSERRVAYEIRARADELIHAGRLGAQLDPERQSLQRWGPDSGPTGPDAEPS